MLLNIESACDVADIVSAQFHEAATQDKKGIRVSAVYFGNVPTIHSGEMKGAFREMPLIVKNESKFPRLLHMMSVYPVSTAHLRLCCHRALVS